MSAPCFAASIYLFLFSTVPNLYPIVLFMLGFSLISSGLYSEWTGALSGYYAANKGIINLRRFLIFYHDRPGRFELRSDAGHIRVTVEDPSGTGETIHEGPLGAIVYSEADREITFQGGAVFERDPSGSSMLKSPKLGPPDAIIPFTITRITGQFDDRKISPEKIPKGRGITTMDLELPVFDASGGAVRIEIQSDHYHEWYRLLREQIDSGSVHPIPETKSLRIDRPLPVDSGSDGLLDIGGIEIIEIGSKSDEPAT